MKNTADVTGGKPIAVLLLLLLNLKSRFATSIEERDKCYYFILSRIPHETYYTERHFRYRCVVYTLVAFYHINGRKREVLFFLSRTPHETDLYASVLFLHFDTFVIVRFHIQNVIRWIVIIGLQNLLFNM
jgi:hypothetical protein